MRCPSQNLHLELEHGELLRLDAGRGWTVRCEDGALMLSGPTPVGDVELRHGQDYTLPTNRLILLEAWRHCRLSLIGP